MKKLERYDVVDQKIVSVRPYHDGTEFTLSNGVTFDTGSVVRKKGKYIGKTVEEVLPYHDGADIRLSGGINLDGAIDAEFKEPKHPPLVKQAYDLMSISEKSFHEAMDKLVGESFKFLGKPCTVTSIKDYDFGEVWIRDSSGKRRKVDIYSLE